MRKILVIVAVMYSAAAIAQSNPPAAKQPMVGDKPLVQVQPKGTATAAKSKSKGAPEKPKSMAQKLQACLEHRRRHQGASQLL